MESRESKEIQSKFTFQNQNGIEPGVLDGMKVRIRLQQLAERVSVDGFKYTPSIEAALSLLEDTIPHSTEQSTHTLPTSYGRNLGGIHGRQLDYAETSRAYEEVTVPEVTEIRIIRRQCIFHARYEDGGLTACEYKFGHRDKHSYERD
jgi:hypothetical protein